MLDYSVVKKKLRKNFPNLTDEEIEKMALDIPAYVPTSAVDALIAMTKACYKDPKKRKLLALKNPSK